MKQPKVFSLIDKVIYDYDLIKKGDRILIGASGGKDSTLLIEYFSNRLKRYQNLSKKTDDKSFEIKCLYIKSEFAPDFNDELSEKIESWGSSVETTEVDILGRLKSDRKMNCYWCSMQRRTELLRYAMDNGYNKIALGHHEDDVLETLLMNMIGKGKLETMTPLFQYDKYPVEIIRPLYYVPEKDIIDHAESECWKKVTCTCSYQDFSQRKEMKKRLELLCNGDEKAKTRLLMSLKNIDKRYLP